MNANEIYTKRVELDKQQLVIFNDMKKYMIEKLQERGKDIVIDEPDSYETENGSFPQKIFLNENGSLTIRFDEGYAEGYHDEDTNALSYNDMCIVFDAFCETIGE